MDIATFDTEVACDRGPQGTPDAGCAHNKRMSQPKRIALCDDVLPVGWPALMLLATALSGASGKADRIGVQSIAVEDDA